MNEETRLSLVGIIVEDVNAASGVNDVLHDFGEYIVGRMGIPYRKQGVSIISVVMDAPVEKVSSLSGKLGMLPGVSVKTMTAKQKG